VIFCKVQHICVDVAVFTESVRFIKCKFCAAVIFSIHQCLWRVRMGHNATAWLYATLIIANIFRRKLNGLYITTETNPCYSEHHVYVIPYLSSNSNHSFFVCNVLLSLSPSKLLWRTWNKFSQMIIIIMNTPLNRCTRWRSRLGHCVTSRKVAGSIPDYIVEIFHWNNPSGRTLALGLTQPLTEMSKSKDHPITGYEGPRGGVQV
jgi:hypothetical protein